MVNSGVKVSVFDLIDNKFLGFRCVYVDSLGYSFIKLKGHFFTLLCSYDFYNEHPRVYIDFNTGVVY